MPRYRLLLPVVLVLGALTVPATAGAAFTGQIHSQTRVQLTGSDAAEHLQISLDGGLFRHDQAGGGFADPFDFDSTVAGRQSVAPVAGLRTLFTVDAEGGDDHVFLLTPEASLSADGGEGNDTIVGSDARDVLQGASGDDLVAGRGSSDSIFLGAGDDRYEWVGKTAGNDRIEGGDGDDTTAVFGTDTADEFTISEDSTGFRVVMAGVGGPRIRAIEALELRLRGGDDIVDPELIPASLRFDIDGGDGNDDLRGGDGNDRIDGEAGTDAVQGSGGDDVVLGERPVGGAGNDVMTLEAGSGGSLLAEDDDGYDVIRLIGSGGADVVSLSRSSSFVRLEGTAGGAPFVAAARSDAVVLETRAGDDSATVQPGAGLVSAISIEGGDGADVLRGSEGLEWLAGALGEDVLDGGLGPDRLLGGPDADIVRARDRAADLVECGSGGDLVVTDTGSLDQLLDGPACEQVQAGPATNPLALARVTATAELRLGSSGIVRVPVTCSQGARGGCLGSVVLVTADPVSIATAKVPVHLGREPFKLAPGASAEVEVFVADGEELVRAAGGRLLQVQAQVVGDLSEHTTKLPLNILK